MPLWTSAKLPSEDTCGWALASVTPPCVAQRVWLIPVLAENFIPPTSSARVPTRPFFLQTRITPFLSRAIPAES